MIAVLAAILSMAAKDALGTLLVVAEAKGRAWLAGIFDAAGDLANIVCVVLGAGSVIKDGLTTHSMILVMAMALTSLVGTTFWTKLGRRIKPHVVIGEPKK